MSKQSKSSKTLVPETQTPVSVAPVSVASVPVASVPAVPVASKKTKATTPKVVTAPVVTPVVAPVVPVVDVPATDTDAVESDTVDLVAQSAEFLSKLNKAGALFASLKAEFRSLEKKWGREIKTAQKSQAKRKRKSGNRQPSGFVKPTKISDELAKFLEKPLGSEMARTDVTREINKYIRSHSLQDKENGRKIIPDAKLQTLLKLSKTDELTYFNLQKFMSPHFAKSEKAVAAALASATA